MSGVSEPDDQIEETLVIPRLVDRAELEAAEARVHAQAARAERERERADEAEASLAARTGERDGLEVRCADRGALVQSLTEALAELVRLKDAKNEPRDTYEGRQKYEAAKARAWAEAKRLLAPLPVPVEGEADR